MDSKLEYAYGSYGNYQCDDGSNYKGCWYNRCANRYAFLITNVNCHQGHYGTCTWSSGWSACPYGYPRVDIKTKEAHCTTDSGWDTLGYRAPCGRTTHRTEDVYGYVTRTRTTTYNKEVGCLSSTLYDVNDPSISTRMGRNSYSRSCTSYFFLPTQITLCQSNTRLTCTRWVI